MSANTASKPGLISQHVADLQQAWKEMRSRPAASLATVLAIASTLLIPILLLLLSTGLSESLARYSANPKITAYLADSDNEDQISRVSERLLQRDDISVVEVVTKEQALQDFSNLGGFSGLLTELENNPLPNTLLITPLPFNNGQLENLAAELRGYAEIEHLEFDIEWIKGLQGFTALLQTLGLAMAALAILGFFLVIGNSVKLTVRQAEDEIKVLKLIGAPDAFILQPLIYSGLLYGLFAAIVAFLLQFTIFGTFNLLIGDFYQEFGGPAPLEISFSLSMFGFFACLLGSVCMGALASGFSAYQAIKALES